MKCPTKKPRFKTHEKAFDAIERLMEQKKVEVKGAYRCVACDGWHLKGAS